MASEALCGTRFNDQPRRDSINENLTISESEKAGFAAVDQHHSRTSAELTKRVPQNEKAPEKPGLFTFCSNQLRLPNTTAKYSQIDIRASLARPERLEGVTHF